MTEQELQVVIDRLRMQRNDDALVEAKSCAGGFSASVWESVSAFANTAGGTIILGVDERSGFTRAKGFEFDRVRNALVEGMGDGAPQGAKLTNVPRYRLGRVGFEGSQVLVVEVDELAPEFKPCYITAKGVVGGSYKRIDDKDIRLAPAEVYELQTMMVSAQSDRAVVAEARRDDLNDEFLSDYIARRRARGSKALRGVSDEGRALSSLGITDRDGGVRLAGLLCFGNYPQGFYPKLTVDVAVFPGASKSQHGMPRFLDREICEGTVDEVLEEALAAIARNLRTSSVVEGAGRVDTLEIPYAVLRESVSNALVHREYAPQFIGQAVSVEVYPDRVEVLSPGGLWGGKSLAELADGTSRCRNDTLMQFMSSGAVVDRLGGAPVEGQGSGIALMRHEMAEAGLPAPRFEAGFDYFKVTLARRGNVVALPLMDVVSKELTASQREVLNLFGDNQEVELGVRDIASALGTSVQAARLRVKGLLDAGMLYSTAPSTSRLRKYRLA